MQSLRPLLRRIRRMMHGGSRQTAALPHSDGYTLVHSEKVDAAMLDGWLDMDVARRQHEAYRPLLEEMEKGVARIDFQVAAQAVAATGEEHPSILEVGCGSGYYSRVFEQLRSAPFEYTGLDYSDAMIELARSEYPRWNFVQGDATALPFADDSFDIVINGAALMHIIDYAGAVAESRRVSRRWSIFHTVPVLQSRQTTVLTKSAYGRPTVEVILNEGEFRDLLTASGLILRHVRESIPYNLEEVLGEPTTTKTFLCEAQ